MTKISYGNITKYYAFKSRELKIPFSGTFELTPRCNMNCKMCYIRMTDKEMQKVGRELTVDEWLKIAKEAVSQGMVMLLLTGGEPLLYKGFKELYLSLRKMGLFISINSNSTLINDEWINFFKQYKPAKINITIYGGSNETYNELCSNPKGFDQLKNAIEALQQNGIEIGLNCTITKQNVHDFKNISDFAKAHNLQLHVTTYNFPPVRKEGVDEKYLNRLTPKEAAKARLMLNWYSVENKALFLNKCYSIQKNYKDDENFSDVSTDNSGDKILCAAGRSNFWITWDGRILPCGMIPDYSLDLKKSNFIDAWKEITEYTDTIRLAPECKTCSMKDLCKPCAAKLKSESGAFDKKSYYLCEYTIEYLNYVNKAINFLENEKNN